jgi:hypothetical protein
LIRFYPYGFSGDKLNPGGLEKRAEINRERFRLRLIQARAYLEYRIARDKGD